jgi:hypothetical protein
VVTELCELFPSATQDRHGAPVAPNQHQRCASREIDHCWKSEVGVRLIS